MRYKNKIRKPNKYCKLFGVELEYEKSLSDAENRLFHIYIRIVDWDIKHKDRFGSSEITIRDMREHYLPNWSIGKISTTQTSLISRGWLEKRPDRTIGVKNYDMYRQKNMAFAERYFHQVRQGLQPTEHNVHLSENAEEIFWDNYKKEKQKLYDAKGIFVQSDEQNDSLKENKRIIKEN